MKRVVLVLSLTALLSVLFAPLTQAGETEFFPIEQIRAGMKGYGITVFEGNQPERFEVEVLGTLTGVQSPKHTVVIARLRGGQVERTGVFAGMSGSPVYIDGKLVGAVAFSYTFSKEPLAGITPIRSMIDNFEAGGEQQQGARPVSFRTLIAGASPEPRASLVATASSSQGLIPIATPVSFSGIPQSVIEMFSSELKAAGLYPVVGISGSSGLKPMVTADENTLTPGKGISVQLVRGDFTIDAAGTVTYRDGERIYAFGHPFLQSGSTSWPMAEASVVTVVPNMANSFKLSSAGNLVGTVNQDRSTGVFGKLGDQPSMIPARVKIHTSRNKTQSYSFEIVSDPFLTPLLLKFSLLGALSATERAIGSQTVGLSGRISIEGQPDIVLDNTFSTPNGAGIMAANSVERPLAALLSSGFKPVSIRGIDVELSSTDTRSSGALNRLWIDKTEVRRGETLEIQAFARHDSGSEFVERIPIEVPADAPLGPLTVLVGDGLTVSQLELRTSAVDFAPRDLGQLVRAINKLKKNNRLYVKVIRSSSGAIVNNEEMPTLPPSMLATLGSERTSGGYTPMSIATLAEKELPPSQFMIIGQQAITINVIK